MSNKYSILKSTELARAEERPLSSSERRTWDSEIRSPWNQKIYTMLKAVDLHVELYISTGDIVHAEMAELLREYVLQLKKWIHKQERR